MKEPIISDLAGVNEDMIECLEKWLVDKQYLNCPFCCVPKYITITDVMACDKLFNNLSKGKHTCDQCPCRTFGREATILAFTIICDVWKGYNND